MAGLVDGQNLTKFANVVCERPLTVKFRRKITIFRQKMLTRKTMHLQWLEIAQILAILENSRLITFIFSFGVILGPKTSLAFNMFVLAQGFC